MCDIHQEHVDFGIIYVFFHCFSTGVQMCCHGPTYENTR